ncbi:MAG: hypothetical protein P1V97_29425 [Planctomycetota bacterium]|nr:hypothetical protein [Planctomycetota bacterium]
MSPRSVILPLLTLLVVLVSVPAEGQDALSKEILKKLEEQQKNNLALQKRLEAQNKKLQDQINDVKKVLERAKSTEAELGRVKKENKKFREQLGKLEEKIDEQESRPAPSATLPDNVKERFENLEGDLTSLKEKSESLFDKTAKKLIFSGYIDAGAFVPTGNGVGFIPDFRNTLASRFPSKTWLFLGDPWTTPVNSRNEPADTDGSFALPFDNINSGGRSSFIINEINLDLFAQLHPKVSINASVDFLPRFKGDGELGDMIDVDLGFLRYEPFDNYDLTLEFGKYISVFGLEYRRQESNDRIGVTPSLIARYVSGRPIGIKMRQRWFKKRLTLNLGLQNSSSHIETFSFGEEIDSNDGKHGSGRLSYDFAHLIGVEVFEIGVSGEIGAQNLQRSNEVLQRQFDFDVRFAMKGFELRGEFIKGKIPGQGEEEAESLDFEGAYIQLSQRLEQASLPFVIVPYARWGYRRALHRGDIFAYRSHSSRVTSGVRLEFTDEIVLKLEYLHNMEHGAVPSFANDLFVASLVASF